MQIFARRKSSNRKYVAKKIDTELPHTRTHIAHTDKLAYISFIHSNIKTLFLCLRPLAGER